MRIATWNVNSIKARLDHAKNWLREQQPDVLMLQELKGLDFPAAEFDSMGYKSEAVGQKAYNGVAILSKLDFNVVLNRLPGAEGVEILGRRLAGRQPALARQPAKLLDRRPDGRAGGLVEQLPVERPDPSGQPGAMPLDDVLGQSPEQVGARRAEGLEHRVARPLGRARPRVEELGRVGQDLLRDQPVDGVFRQLPVVERIEDALRPVGGTYCQ